MATPPHPNTGTATSLWPADSSARATAVRASRTIANARRNRCGVLTVHGVNTVRFCATRRTVAGGAKAKIALPAADACAGKVAPWAKDVTGSGPGRFSM